MLLPATKRKMFSAEVPRCQRIKCINFPRCCSRPRAAAWKTNITRQTKRGQSEDPRLGAGMHVCDLRIRANGAKRVQMNFPRSLSSPAHITSNGVWENRSRRHNRLCHLWSVASSSASVLIPKMLTFHANTALSLSKCADKGTKYARKLDENLTAKLRHCRSPSQGAMDHGTTLPNC